MSRVSIIIGKKEIERIGREATLLVEDIAKAESSIKIYGGEGYLLYNHHRVVSAFRRKKASNPGLKIDVILSPMIFVEAKILNGTIYKYNGLLELAKEKIINLYVRTTRTKQFHYRIIDDGKKRYRIEEYHNVLAPFIERKRSQPLGVDISKLGNDFDNLIMKKEVTESIDPSKEFVLLTCRDILKVFKKAGERFDDLTYNEILQLSSNL